MDNANYHFIFICIYTQAYATYIDTHILISTHMYVCMYVCSLLAAAAAAKSLQSCPTLCDPIDGSPPGSAVPGILQARTLEWV